MEKKLLYVAHLSVPTYYYHVLNFYFIHFQTEEITRLTGVYKRLLSNAGVKLFEGEGRVIGPNDVEIIQLDGTKISYSAKHILIATGSRAQRPAIPGKVWWLYSKRFDVQIFWLDLYDLADPNAFL